MSRIQINCPYCGQVMMTAASHVHCPGCNQVVDVKSLSQRQTSSPPPLPPSLAPGKIPTEPPPIFQPANSPRSDASRPETSRPHASRPHASRPHAASTRKTNWLVPVLIVGGLAMFLVVTIAIAATLWMSGSESDEIAGEPTGSGGGSLLESLLPSVVKDDTTANETANDMKIAKQYLSSKSGGIRQKDEKWESQPLYLACFVPTEGGGLVTREVRSKQEASDLLGNPSKIHPLAAKENLTYKLDTLKRMGTEFTVQYVGSPQGIRGDVTETIVVAYQSRSVQRIPVSEESDEFETKVVFRGAKNAVSQGVQTRAHKN